MRARLPVPGILIMANEGNIEIKSVAMTITRFGIIWKARLLVGGSGGLSPPAPGPGVNSSYVRNGMQMRTSHLAAESGCVRMERRAETKYTCLLLMKMMVSTIMLVVVIMLSTIVLVVVEILGTILLQMKMMLSTTVLVEMNTRMNHGANGDKMYLMTMSSFSNLTIPATHPEKRLLCSKEQRTSSKANKTSEKGR